MYRNVYKLLSLKYHSSPFRHWFSLNYPCQVFFFSWTVNEGLYREKTTHTNSLDKKWRVTWNHCEESGDKNICLSGFTQHTHTRHFCKNSQVCFFFFMWESLRHIMSFSPFCVSVPNKCCGTKWCRKESNLVSSFFTFLMVQGAFFPPSAAARVSNRRRGERLRRKAFTKTSPSPLVS